MKSASTVLFESQNILQLFSCIVQNTSVTSILHQRSFFELFHCLIIMVIIAETIKTLFFD